MGQQPVRDLRRASRASRAAREEMHRSAVRSPSRGPALSAGRGTAPRVQSRVSFSRADDPSPAHATRAGATHLLGEAAPGLRAAPHRLGGRMTALDDAPPPQGDEIGLRRLGLDGGGSRLDEDALSGRAANHKQTGGYVGCQVYGNCVRRVRRYSYQPDPNSSPSCRTIQVCF